MSEKCAACGAAILGRCQDCNRPLRRTDATRCRSCSDASRIYWTCERVVAAIQRWVAQHGEVPKKSDWCVARPEHPRRGQVERRFGSWAAGIRAAGYEPRGVGKRGPGWDRDVKRERKLVA